MATRTAAEKRYLAKRRGKVHLKVRLKKDDDR